MVKLRYKGGMDVYLMRHSGDKVDLKDGDLVEMTEAEAAGVAIIGEHPSGIFERVVEVPIGKVKTKAEEG